MTHFPAVKYHQHTDKHAIIQSRSVSHAAADTLRRTMPNVRSHRFTRFPAVRSERDNLLTWEKLMSLSTVSTHTYTEITGLTQRDKRSSTCCHARPVVFRKCCWECETFLPFFFKATDIKGQQGPLLWLTAAVVPLSKAFSPRRGGGSAQWCWSVQCWSGSKYSASLTTSTAGFHAYVLATSKARC